MDFIKTSSLRALIELTFQRNWNGLIWMSRKGVIAKRVKTAPDGYIENQRRTRSPAGRGTNVPRSAKTVFRPTEVSAKVQPLGRSHITTRETLPAVGQATTPRHAAHDQAREPGTKPRGRATRSAYHGRCIRPSREERPASGRRNHRPNPSVRPPADHETSGPDRSDSAKDPTVRPTVPTTVRTPRSTRSRF
ncbi:unnamed protein product [Microthlaspi erraticum]|uniref:Uncharacterized protein n=1 Tax=Microthlaspi erraticum TaxID=1685480 RepID=A0A6D2L655_9BRAS|nr:unnamed protein product [Microthlaspi erraticum]